MTKNKVGHSVLYVPEVVTQHIRWIPRKCLWIWIIIPSINFSYAAYNKSILHMNISPVWGQQNNLASVESKCPKNNLPFKVRDLSMCVLMTSALLLNFCSIGGIIRYFISLKSPEQHCFLLLCRQSMKLQLLYWITHI